MLPQPLRVFFAETLQKTPTQECRNWAMCVALSALSDRGGHRASEQFKLGKNAFKRSFGGGGSIVNSASYPLESWSAPWKKNCQLTKVALVTIRLPAAEESGTS